MHEKWYCTTPLSPWEPMNPKLQLIAYKTTSALFRLKVMYTTHTQLSSMEVKEFLQKKTLRKTLPRTITIEKKNTR